MDYFAAGNSGAMIGEPLIELSRVDSTNSYAARAFTGCEPADGTVVWAREQYAGRGQQDHVWLSEPGRNLTFTVCLRPHFLPAYEQFALNRAIALGMADAVRFFLGDRISGPGSNAAGPMPAVRIKWPNDLYTGDRKIGGILIEHRIMGSRLDMTLAGIGVNINQTDFPATLPNPVSLAQLTGRAWPVDEALKQSCRFLDERYRKLRTGKARQASEFDSLLIGFGEWRTFEKEGVLFEGMIEGTDPSGLLKVRRRNGELQLFSHGEIKL